MALVSLQGALTTSPQSLYDLLVADGLSTTAADFAFVGFDVILSSGTETGYGGGSTVTNVPAKAGFKFTASIGYATPSIDRTSTISKTKNIYLVATAAATALIHIWA